MDISHLDPEIQFYLRRVWALVDPKTVAKDIEEKRWLFERRTLAWNLPAPEDIEQMDWAMNLPGRELTFRMHRPVGAERPPVVLYFHGGGWSLGSYKTHDMVTWEMARGTGAAVINVN